MEFREWEGRCGFAASGTTVEQNHVHRRHSPTFPPTGFKRIPLFATGTPLFLHPPSRLRVHFTPLTHHRACANMEPSLRPGNPA
jgi:hypothetical protein